MAVRGAKRGWAGTLVGRTEERDAIVTALHEAASGRPSVVWVEGEAGFGKTALVRHALKQAPAGMQVLEAQADELATEVSFELASRLGSSSTQSSFTAGLELLEVWGRRQDSGPVAVVVEDLHWADTASSKALLCAAQRLEEDRVALVVTARPGVRDGWERVHADSQRCSSIDLTALTIEEVAALAASEGTELSPSQAERLHRHTGGHPLYVHTLLTELSPAELRGSHGDLPAPASLTSSVVAGLSEVPESARRLAAAMAVVNQRIGLFQIGQVAGVAAPIGPFEELLGTGFVRWDATAPGTPVEFAHPLYRHAIYRDLAPRTRRDLHRSAAAISSPEGALAHRVAAADGTDDALADELAASAARDQNGPAVGLRARNLVWSSALSSDPARSEERLLAAAQAYVESGQTRRAAEIRPRLAGCAASPQRDLLLGLVEWDEGHPAEARSWLEAVVDPERGTTDGETAARAWAELAEIHVIEGRPREAIDAATEAKSLASPNTSAERLAWMHLSLAEAFLSGGPAGLDCLRQRLPDQPQNVMASDADLLVMRATLSLYSGQVVAALADLRAVVNLTRRDAVPVQIARCHFELATVLVSTGAWDEALIHARTGLGIAAGEGQTSMHSQCQALMGTILAYRGEFAAAEEAMSAAMDEASLRGDIEATATALMANAAIGEARQEPARVISSLQMLPGKVPMLGRLAFWPPLIGALIDTGELDLAENQITELKQGAAARRLQMDARVLGLRARLAIGRGQLDDAMSLFEAAVTGYGADDPLLERALLLCAYGRALLDTGQRKRAAGVLGEAQVALTAMGARPFAERVALDLAPAGVQSRAGDKVVKSARALTGRERDVAVLVSKGLTNPEVAQELYVSRKAVEYHLSNIFGKLGISSRRALRGLTF
jgi:DNA-binding CsgD family transcriptional regulator/tetratricopeptide (TPR) repeat protein